jgi:glycosyltransferase involved in cell wall biosynthesis
LHISVIITTYNYAAYIERALQSLIQQWNHNGGEIIVIDDGSTDNTAAVVGAFQQQFPFVQYHYQANAGKAAATQKGIELATGDIMCILDADDWFLPGKLQQTLHVFMQYPQVVHVASPAQIVWEDGSRSPVAEPVPGDWLGSAMNGTQLLQTFYRKNILFGGGSTFAARASVLKQMPWDAAIDMYTDEWLLLWTLRHGNSFFLKEPLSVWYIHQSNYSGKGGERLLQKNKRLQQSSEAVWQALQQHDFPSWLQQLYGLKHAVRVMHWKEQEGTKSMADRWRFFTNVLVKGGHSLPDLWHHHAFNRLLK